MGLGSLCLVIYTISVCDIVYGLCTKDTPHHSKTSFWCQLGRHHKPFQGLRFSSLREDSPIDYTNEAFQVLIRAMGEVLKRVRYSNLFKSLLNLHLYQVICVWVMDVVP